MESISNPLPGPEGEGPAPAASKLGLIGTILGALGGIFYCLPLAVAFFLGASGNAPAADSPMLIGIGLVSNCGAVVGVVGGILGIVSLVRGENKTYGIIAIVIGALLLCTCAGLSLTGAMIGG